MHALSQRRNELAPISFLPTEIIADIFLLASAKRDDLGLAWLNVAHVCRQWSEIALNQRLFWSHINFSNLTLTGTAEMLARAKGAPLHLEARVTDSNWSHDRYRALDQELQAHVSHIRHLDIIVESLRPCLHLGAILHHTLYESPAPILEYLSLSNEAPGGIVSIPNNAFKGITPRLFSLELRQAAISLKSPLLRGLRYLKIYELNDVNRLSVTDWLDALDEMPRLKELVFHAASPLTDDFTFPSDVNRRTATLPVLTHLDLSSPAVACALALAHLVLPALTSLIVEARSFDRGGSDALILIQYLTRHAHGPQDPKPLQSVLFHNYMTYTRIVAWPTVIPDIHGVAHCKKAERTARVVLSISCKMPWYTSINVRVLDAVIEALPLDGLVALAAEYQARLYEQVWLHHAPRWPLLEHVQLAPLAARGLREMLLLEDNGGHEGPLLPSLRQLDLLDTSLTKRRTLRLCDALKKRVQQGVPLKVLSWSTNKWTIGAVWLLRRFVGDVRGPKGDSSWKRGEAPAWDPETDHFVDSDEDSDEEVENV